MNHKWNEIKKQENIRVLAAIGLTALLLFLLSVAGTLQNGKPAPAPAPAQKEAPMAKAKAGKESLPDKAVVSLSDADKEFLNSLISYFDSGDLEGAARLIDSYPLNWSEYPILYDGTALSKEIVAPKGMVFLKPTTVFYGEFAAGLPQGKCTALQVITLDEGKRYDYSYGTWSQGKMNGSGASGYNYYDGAIGDINKKSAKEGNFKDDLMEGEVTYTTTNASGETAKWDFQTADGVIVLDDRWIQEHDDEGKVIYKRMADQEENHAYTLSESGIKEDRWKNFIQFSTD